VVSFIKNDCGDVWHADQLFLQQINEKPGGHREHVFFREFVVPVMDTCLTAVFADSQIGLLFNKSCYAEKLG
jgi:hypothetical protein